MSDLQKFLYLVCKLRKNKLKFEIMEGYCVKCKAKKEIKDGAEVTMKNDIGEK